MAVTTNVYFFPKWTTLLGTVGGTTYYSEVWNVAGASALNVDFYAEVVVGTIGVTMEHSTDNSTWSDLVASQAASATTTLEVNTASAPKQYVRLKVTVTDSGSMLTFWSEGTVTS